MKIQLREAMFSDKEHLFLEQNFLNFLKIDLTPFTVCDIMDSALLCDEKCGARLALVLWCGA